ncbi:dehydrogenase [Dietzia sp. ANT_WB102]|nr:dehydrogenase [Dietzia sp. ANT_WB102]
MQDASASRRPVVVLVPDARGLEAFDGVTNVEPLVWDLSGDPPAGADRAQVLVTQVMDPPTVLPRLEALPQLRVIQLFSAGTDAWAGFAPEGVEISGADDIHGGTVAEWVVATLLAHLRDLYGYREKQRAHQWERRWTGTLAGKHVLVLGAGDIGRNVARRLEPFDAVVTTAARTARADVLDLASARDRLGDYDVVVLALPLTDDTEHLVGADFLAAMKDGAVLVNAGRGPLVDTDALLAELTAGRLTALLDVTDPEPLPVGHPLWDAPGAVITPHSAAITDDTLDRCWRAIVRKVGAFAQPPESATP